MLRFLGTEFGPTILLIVPMIISLLAQFMVKSTFAKYSRVPNSRGLNGAQTAKAMMKINGITGVAIQSIGGTLTDHYDPTRKVLRLSEPVYDSNSIAALGVAAHETGHAIQHKVGYAPLVLRSTLVPVANIGSRLGMPMVFVGIMFTLPFLTKLGIILFGGAVAFYLVTLPVEFNASHRALQNLKNNNFLTTEELNGARKVLTAAAMTYVASALTAVFNLLRLILIARNRNKD